MGSASISPTTAGPESPAFDARPRREPGAISMIDRALIDELAQFSTPTVLNGLKRLGCRPDQLESIHRSAVRCQAPALGVSVGFAVTRKVVTRRAGAPPTADAGSGRPHEDVLAQPEPRIL